MKSIQAKAATAIRKELKAAFPGVKFRIRSTSASMMTAVRVRWTDGPTVKAVDKIVAKYEYGSFNGMTDCYEYDSSGEYDHLPRVKYVSCTRDMSDELKDKIRHAYDCEISIDDDEISYVFRNTSFDSSFSPATL